MGASRRGLRSWAVDRLLDVAERVEAETTVAGVAAATAGQVIGTAPAVELVGPVGRRRELLVAEEVVVSTLTSHFVPSATALGIVEPGAKADLVVAGSSEDVIFATTRVDPVDVSSGADEIVPPAVLTMSLPSPVTIQSQSELKSLITCWFCPLYRNVSYPNAAASASVNPPQVSTASAGVANDVAVATPISSTAPAANPRFVVVDVMILLLLSCRRPVWLRPLDSRWAALAGVLTTSR